MCDEECELRRCRSRGMSTVAVMAATGAHDQHVVVLNCLTTVVADASRAGSVSFCAHVSEAWDAAIVSGASDFCALRARPDVRWLPAGTRRVGLAEVALDRATVRWGELVHGLVARHKLLLETLAQISTLGGGWASVGERGRAKQYAVQQRSVARMLQDETLELLSEVYIAYADLFEGRRQAAGEAIERQAGVAAKRSDKRQKAIIEAAFIQLARYDEQQQQQQQRKTAEQR